VAACLLGSKIVGVSKEGQFPLLEKKMKTRKGPFRYTNKVDVAARGRLAVCFLDGNASKMLTQPLLKFQCYVFTYLVRAHAKQARNSEGRVPRCVFPQKNTHKI
jgi:hypothetical protein